MSRGSQALAAVAGAVVGAGLLGGAYLTVEPIVTVEHVAAPVASASPTPSAAPSPAPTAITADCVWEDLPEDLRPPVLVDEPEGLPEARAMTAAVWSCVGEGWDVAVHSADGDTWRLGGTAQALYLEAPDGDLLKLFDLRTDVEVVVLEADLDARVAWTARLGGGDGYQVVEVELESGLVVDDWGGDAIPSLQRDEESRMVYSVAPRASFGGEGTLWAGYTYTGAVQSLFVREAGSVFRALGAQKALDSLLAQGSVNGHGEGGDEVWLDESGTVAMFLAQSPVEIDPALSGKKARKAAQDSLWRSDGGTWVVVDLVTDQWRLVDAGLPEGLCRPAPDTYIPGTAEAPGELQALCLNGGEDEDGYDIYLLSLDADGRAKAEERP
ncbi:hypothetical protein [Demequina iriomotensis]|uniref:hypothetical protein n=1 Tax=Demequina iriomotensis TaxID=1536641 RepID=UPI0007809491|nr:hypothetical protein [Demequina iriomotensis]